GPADALGPVGGRETEVGVEAEPQLVAVEHVGRPARGDQKASDLERDRGFAGTGEPGEPHGQAPAGSVQRVDAPTVAHDRRLDVRLRRAPLLACECAPDRPRRTAWDSIGTYRRLRGYRCASSRPNRTARASIPARSHGESPPTTT